jgi:hypothetical protein
VAAKHTTPKPMRKGLPSMTLLIAWLLWKQRNACVFEGERSSTKNLLSQIRKEAALWAKAGGKWFACNLAIHLGCALRPVAKL